MSESIRKDSECTFGIEKKRFICLRLPFLIYKKNNVGNVFRTCAILHNMVLQYDGLVTIGEFDEDYNVITDNYNTDVQDDNT